MSEDIKIVKGVRQSCMLSPLLFNVLKDIFWAATKDARYGVIIMGDLFIISGRQKTRSSLQATVWNCNEWQILWVRSEPFGVILKLGKTKVTVFAKKHTPITITVKIEAVQQVTAYRYLGTQAYENCLQCSKRNTLENRTGQRNLHSNEEVLYNNRSKPAVASRNGLILCVSGPVVWL